MAKRILGLTPTNYKKFLKNLLKFTAPVIAILFAQLATGVNWKQASLVALYALYAILADFFKKIK